MAQKRKSLDESALEFFKSPIPESAEAPAKAAELVALELIHLPKQQPRRYFDARKLQSLVQSVKEHGILEPLLVRPLSDKQYELVAGERRYRAAKEVNLSQVPVVIRELSESEALQLALVENLQREDLNPVEETEGVLQLLALKLSLTVDEVTSRLYRMYNEVKGNVNSANPNVRVSDQDPTVQSVFDSLGLMGWESFVKNRLPLLNLPPELKEALSRGEIAYTKAQAIARVKDEQERKALLEAALNENLSLSQIKERIASLKDKSADNNEGEPSSLRSRMATAYTKAKKSKIWEDPKKQKRLKKLLAELEALVSEG
ncbi:ParB/RepB/Spo0J family partition protein [Allocoleopsis sp.]|uniref:ParB/RepB/Spo0J family partition protein n=1 Tax=Allocoleopsis sp. TaxID=3088169 RepID=UPI002FCFF631